MSFNSLSSFTSIDAPSEYAIAIENELEINGFKIRYRSNSVISISGKSEASLGTLPVIKVLGTGGTIASKGLNAHQTAGYKVDLTIEDLIKSIPDLSSTCVLEYEQVLNVDSKEINTHELLLLYHKIQQNIHNYDGIVITHGTDTMEETAFFIQSTINTYKPIVFCGSMRPSTAISSDGPMNLYQAIVIASSRASRGRGVMVALNDRIGSGFYITKSNANSLDTFKSVGQGYIGNFVNNEIHFYFPAAKPLGLTYFHINNNLINLPEVAIIYGHQGLNKQLIKLAIENLNCQGLVLATMGAGSMSDDTNKFICELTLSTQIPIVYSKRAMDGMVPTGSIPNLITCGDKVIEFSNAIAGGYLNPAKSRILLQLCLNDNMQIPDIKKVFKGVYGG